MTGRRQHGRTLSRGLAAVLVTCAALCAAVPALAAPPVWRSSVTLGNGQTFTGVGQGGAVPSSPLILSSNAGLAGSDPAEARLCFLGTLDPAKVAGKIAVCDRGVNARTDKSQAVANAGGIGMVLVNPSPNSLDADVHAVPTVHLDDVSGSTIKAYAATPGATASLPGAVRVFAPSTTSLVASSNPSAPGAPVAFTATVDAGGLDPTGSVMFTTGGLPIPGCAPVALAAGQAICTVSPFSDATIEAAYSGDDGLDPSATTLAHQVIRPKPPSLPKPQTTPVMQPGISGLALDGRCARRSKAGRVRLAMSVQLTQPAALEILVERAVGSRGRRKCPPESSTGEPATRFRPRMTVRRGVGEPAAVARRVTIRPRLAAGLYRLTIRAERADGSLSPPVRGLVRVLKR